MFKLKKYFNSNEIMEYKRLVCSGASIRGYTYVGVLKALEEYKCIQNFEEFVGTSSGAFFCTLILLGYTSEQLYKIFMNYNTEQIVDIKLSNLLETYGLSNNNEINRLLCIFIQNKGFDENITLNELYMKTNKKITIVVTNVNKRCVEYFNYQTQPDIQLRIALQISMNIPVIFSPIKLNDCYYVDGGLSHNMPIKYCNDEISTFCVTLNEVLVEQHHEINTFVDYLHGMLKTMLNTIEKNDIEHLQYLQQSKNCYDLLIIKTTIKTDSIQFKMEDKVKQELFELGYTKTCEFIISKNKLTCNSNTDT